MRNQPPAVSVDGVLASEENDAPVSAALTKAGPINSYPPSQRRVGHRSDAMEAVLVARAASLDIIPGVQFCSESLSVQATASGSQDEPRPQASAAIRRDYPPRGLYASTHKPTLTRPQCSSPCIGPRVPDSHEFPL